MGLFTLTLTELWVKRHGSLTKAINCNPSYNPANKLRDGRLSHKRYLLVSTSTFIFSSLFSRNQFNSSTFAGSPSQIPPLFTFVLTLTSSSLLYERLIFSKHFNNKTMSTVVSLLILLLIASNSLADFLEAPYFQNSPQCGENVINIAMTLDETYLRGSMAAILSILHHSTCPQNLYFHLIYSQRKYEDHNLRTIISTSFPYLRFNMYPFNEETVKGLISTSVRQALDRPLNYARSYLSRLLPNSVHRVIYLDSDVIVLDDISKLWTTKFINKNSVIAAPEYCDTNISRYFTPSFWSNPTLTSTFKRRRSKACYFNTGVMVVDLKTWRLRDYTREIEEWMEVQKRTRIYELGSLPPFLLVFAGEVTAVGPKWNKHGLGGDNYEGECRGLHKGESSLLHWSGRGKPWVRLDEKRACPVDALWAPYDMLRKPYHTLDN